MGSTITGALGITENQSPYAPQLDAMSQMFQQRANNPSGIATKAFEGMANEAAGNVRSGIAQAKGASPSAVATMADIAGSRMQGQAAQQAGAMGLQEQQMNQNMATNLLMGMNKQDLEQKNLQQKRLAGTISGLAGAGAGAGMFGKDLQDYAKKQDG